MDEFRIQIVEDDQALRSLTGAELGRWGFTILASYPAGDLMADFVRFSPHLVILDVGLPRFDGFEWCARFRSVSRVPIIFLTARSLPADAVRGLVEGGDDWITKPFDMELLVAHIRALLRRSYTWAESGIRLLAREGLVLDRERGIASLDGLTARLSRNETVLLARLLERNGRVVARNELMDALWSEDSFVDDNTLTVNMTRLRTTLASIGASDRIETVRGAGYRMK